MKQHSFTSQLKSLAVVFGIALTFASCSNEDVAQNPTNPNDDNDKNLTTFVAGDETKTRTSLDYNSSDFSWEAGDYGTATATGAVGGSIFSFQLEHQPAYLVFQPYTSNTILHNCYLTGVEVTSDNDIAETYTVNTSTGAITGSAGGKKIVLTTKGGSNPNGFPLTNSSASVTTNGAYMVIKPGTHTLKVRYWVKDNATGTEGTITKLLPSTAYASNTYYNLTANLNVKDYDGDHYYMWDAQEQYWKGHDWYISNPASQSCVTLPNANEMTWYAAKGDPRWDTDELWTTMGHLYKGGIWFKKKTNISGYDKNQAVDGTDWRTTKNNNSWSVSHSLPEAADASNYFYLPALGEYDSGKLNFVGELGYYWSSSANPKSSDGAYYLRLYNGDVYVSVEMRDFGFRVDPSFE